MYKFISFVKRLFNRSPYLSLLILGIAVRCIVHVFYGGSFSTFGDTGSYTPLAERLATLNLEGYEGWRTPGYPFLLMLTGIHFKATVLVQALLGVVTSLLTYSISFRISKSIAVAFISALGMSFFLHILFYERAILTETLTLFCLTLTLWYMVRNDFFSTKESQASVLSIKHITIISLLMMVTFLVRPMFIVVVPLVVVFYIIQHKEIRLSKLIVHALLLCLPATIAYQGWSILNEHNTGYKSVTAFSGINLAQNCVHFIEKSTHPDQKLISLYTRKRDSMITHGGDVSMSVWRVYGELKAKENITVSGLSQRFNTITKPLIKAQPLDYLKQVGVSWRDFWKESLLWNYNKIENRTIQMGLTGLWLYIQQPILLVLNITFILVALLMCLSRLKKRRLLLNFEFFCVILVVGSSLGQALVIYGNNDRFSVPFLPLILIVVFQYIHQARMSKSILPK